MVVLDALRIDPVDEYSKRGRMDIIQLKYLSLSFLEWPVESGSEVKRIEANEVFVYDEGFLPRLAFTVGHLDSDHGLRLPAVA